MSHSQESTPLVVRGLHSSHTIGNWCANDIPTTFIFILHTSFTLIQDSAVCIELLGALCTPLKNIGGAQAPLAPPFLRLWYCSCGRHECCNAYCVHHVYIRYVNKNKGMQILTRADMCVILFVSVGIILQKRCHWCYEPKKLHLLSSSLKKHIS